MLQPCKLYLKEFGLDLLNKIPQKSPSFFIVGASRSGSTYLHHMLKNHPEVFMPQTKELHYFNKNAHYRESLLGYRGRFHGYQKEKIIGEVTPFYFYANMLYDEADNIYRTEGEDSISRIKKHYPDARIILSLRDPYKRIVSMYKKNFYQGKTDKNLSTIIKDELFNNGQPNLVYRNKYDIHISNILESFPRAALKVIIFEEWINDYELACREICEFLDIRYDPKFAHNVPKGKNTAQKYENNKGFSTLKADTTLDDEVKELLVQQLTPGQKFVENLLQKEMPWSI